MSSSPQAKPRIYVLDALQWLAMLDIVAFHVDPEARPRMLLGIGLPLFLITTIIFSVRQQAGKSLVVLARRRWGRLMWPWVAWSLVYGIYYVVKAWMDDERTFLYLEPEMLLTGTEDHLWFLPFAFVAGLTMYWVAARLRKLPAAGRDIFALVLLLLCFAVAMNVWGWSLDFPYGDKVFALPSLALGLLIGRWWESGLLDRRRVPMGIVGSILAAAGIVWLVMHDQGDQTPARYTAATGFVLLAFSFGTRRVPGWWMHVHEMLFGVYLVHVLLLFLYYSIADAAGFQMPFQLVALLIMAVSIGAVWLIHKTPMKKVT